MDKNIKFKLIGLLLLIVVSCIVFFSTIHKKKESKVPITSNISSKQKYIKIESSQDTIIDLEADRPNECKEEKTIIWIKNITFLADNDVTYAKIMNLKNKLNDELKALDDSIYEVNLLENSYEKTENGFKINAKADKLNGNIKIELEGKEYTFTIIY